MMKQLKRASAVALLLLLVSVPGHAVEDPAPLDLDLSRRVIAMIDASSKLSSVFALCPADAFERDAPFYGLYVKPTSISATECAHDPVTCYKHCVDDAQSGSCFGLARAFQLHSDLIDKRYAQTLFAMACDNGMGSGCTNRASSLRNVPIEGEPMRSIPEKEQVTCEYRSFRIGCTQGDAWSCAMLGQSYDNGEGVVHNAREARRHYRKACDIAPNFVACHFARSKLEELDKLVE